MDFPLIWHYEIYQEIKNTYKGKDLKIEKYLNIQAQKIKLLQNYINPFILNAD